jgi:uncharacterized protein YukE
MAMIHMDTEQARALATRIGQLADEYQQQASQLQSQIEGMSWQGNSRDEFVGETVNLMSGFTKSTEALGVLRGALEQEIVQWEEAAAVFGGGGTARASYAGVAVASSAGVVAAGGAVVAGSVQTMGAVLGTSTAAQPTTKWAQQNEQYQSLLQEKAALEAKAAEIERMIAEGASLDDINRKIADLEAQKAELEKAAEKWYNKVVPDLPLQGDDDGAPWRVRADDYEDQLQTVNDDLDSLYAQRDLLSQRQDVLAQIEKLNIQVAQVQPPDSVKIDSDVNLFPSGQWEDNCAKYVRTLAPEIGQVPSAKDWIAEHQLSPMSVSNDADLRMSVEPGDVVVWNADQKYADKDDGHAAIITEVHEDYVVLAESNWGEGHGSPRTDRQLSRQDINGLYVWSNPEK